MLKTAYAREKESLFLRNLKFEWWFIMGINIRKLWVEIKRLVIR